MTFQNHYAILGVARAASYTDIKTAYNKLVLISHPDKGGSEAEFITIQAAWEVLRDATARAAFDRNYPTATGVPGKPAQAQGTFPQGSPFSRSQPFGGKSEPKPDPRFYTNAQPPTAPPPTTKPDAWTSFRDSPAGNAYSSYHGFSRGSPPRQSKPEDTSRNQARPNQNDAQEPKDTPMSEAPQAEETSHGRPRQSRPKSRNSNTNAKTRNPSPPPFRGSWSLPPEKHEEVDVGSVKDLADQAKRNVDRFKGLGDSFRKATSNHPCTELSEGIDIKLRHVRFYLENCELKIRLYVYAAKEHNADIRAKKSPTPLPTFYPTLAREHLDTNDEDISDLKAAMQRVFKDVQEMLRMKKAFEANGRKQTDNEQSVRNLQSSTEALDRLLANILTGTMRTGFPSDC